MAVTCGVCEQDGLERAFAVEESLLTHVQTVHADLIEEDAEQAAKTPPGANAPYKIQKRGAKFVVVNNTGAVKATFDNRPAALKYLAALYASVKGAPKRAANTKFTGKAKDRVPAKTEAAKDFTSGERKAAAKTGAAQSDGSFPIKTVADLMNAIKAYGRAKNKASAKAHIIARAKALKATHRLPKEWNVPRGSSSGDNAHRDEKGMLTCGDAACERRFVDEYALYEHAEAVHTFSDTTRILSEYLRETYGRRGDYRAEPPIPSIYCWVEDIATDWVVFSVESDDSSIYKASYSISADNKVTLGAPVEVVRRTVYDPVSDSDPLPTPTTTGS